MAKLTDAEQAIIAHSRTIHSAEVYSDMNKKLNMKENTLQQSTRSSSDIGNVGRAAPSLLAPPIASLQELKENSQRPKPKQKSLEDNMAFARKLRINDLIVEMHCQLGKWRTGRYKRINAYFSIKTQDDIRYKIFLRSSATSALDETLRSIRNNKNNHLLQKAQDYISKYDNILLGRIRYTPKNGFISEQHRPSLSSALFALWISDDQLLGELYLNGEHYPFNFTTDISDKQKKSFYEANANWQRYDTEFSGFEDE
jgi:hypothetical protein